MSDVNSQTSGFSCLFAVAAGQQGHFTTGQARACGIRSNLLKYHLGTGRIVRVRRKVYRLRDYPAGSREEVIAAWLAVGNERSVVSHDSALDLLDLSDVIPDAIHLTVPRSIRHFPVLPDVVVHTTTRRLRPIDLTSWEGVKLTSATRTIVDAAEYGTAPDQIELAVQQALERGLTTPELLMRESKGRGRQIFTLVTGGLLDGLG